MENLNTIDCDLPDDIVLWKYPSNSFSSLSSILVKDNQKAAIMINGKVCDVLDTGVYKIGHETLPGLYSKLKLANDYSGMITADIWFVGQQHSSVQNWQINSLETETIIDVNYTKIKVAANGTLSISLRDPAALFSNLQLGNNTYTISTLFALLRADILSKIPILIGEKLVHDGMPAGSLKPPYDIISGYCLHSFNEKIAPLKGYKLVSFNIANLSFIEPQLSNPIITTAPTPQPIQKPRY